MKNVFRFVLMIIVLTGFVANSALAAHNDKWSDHGFVMTNIMLESANPTKVPNADCQAELNKTIHVSAGSQEQQVGNVTMSHFKYLRKHVYHGTMTRIWSADYSYKGKSGKVYKGKTYGQEVMLEGSNVIYGAFNNGSCKGIYKKVLQ